ncbi:MAG: class I SAM-dependent methyltransferase [Gemmatimonadaceae bacterium]
MPIRNVSDTARWVAVYRAMETERSDAIFHDPFARRLAGERGERIVDELRRGRESAWAMIVRTAVFDEVILDVIRNGGATHVINLAAGLDARPWRLSLPPSLHWIDVDLPAILEYKAEVIGDARPHCRYEAVPADLTDPAARAALLARLGEEAAGGQALVVTEGLLIYLTPEQVGALARDLHAVPPLRWWLIDLATPDLLRMLSRDWGSTLERGNAPFLFAPAEGPAFFRRFGWREREFRSALDEARRLRREMRGMWLWRLIGRLSSVQRRERMRRMSGFVLLERVDDGGARAR